MHRHTDREKRRVRERDSPLALRTANGTISADREIDVSLATKGRTKALVMKDSPSLLSLGRRCMDEGYAFTWPASGDPVLVAPDGTRHVLRVVNYVPVLPLVDEAEPPTEPAAAPDVPLAADPGMDPNSVKHQLTHFQKRRMPSVARTLQRSWGRPQRPLGV